MKRLRFVYCCGYWKCMTATRLGCRAALIPGHHDARGEQGLLLLSVLVEAVLDGTDGRVDVGPLAGGVNAEAEVLLR